MLHVTCCSCQTRDLLLRMVIGGSIYRFSRKRTIGWVDRLGSGYPPLPSLIRASLLLSLSKACSIYYNVIMCFACKRFCFMLCPLPIFTGKAVCGRTVFTIRQIKTVAQDALSPPCLLTSMTYQNGTPPVWRTVFPRLVVTQGLTMASSSISVLPFCQESLAKDSLASVVTSILKGLCLTWFLGPHVFIVQMHIIMQLPDILPFKGVSMDPPILYVCVCVVVNFTKKCRTISKRKYR